ncbi:MAG: hypothetical protein JXA94_06860 [Parachlamydiales bacterium]|nr:hypothetical protein [Parachlamydiales bacterium]
MRKLLELKRLTLTLIYNLYRKKFNTDVSVLMEKTKTINNYLVITASGGGGLLQAAKAEKQRILKNNPTANIVTRDLMLQWMGFPFGYFGVGTWNLAQKRGIKIFQTLFGFGTGLADIIFYPVIFIRAFITLMKHDIDQIVDTQCVGTNAIIKALRLFNFIRNKNTKIYIVIVDLPTKKSTHFFNSIKRLTIKDKNLLTIHTAEPLLENETEEEFWQKYCRVSLDKINYQYPIRISFDDYKNKTKNFDLYPLKIIAENEKEIFLIESVLKKGSCSFFKENNTFNFNIGKEDYLITVLLGSQPSYKSTVEYVKKVIDFLSKKDIQKNVYLFVFCSSLKLGLMQKLYSMIQNIENFPKNLNVVPMSFQSDEIIAPIFHRSDLTVTRSGGQTAIELKTVCSGKKCVHSESRSKNITLKKLLKGIPVWESGNAVYMKEKMGIEIINTDLFAKVLVETIN